MLSNLSNRNRSGLNPTSTISSTMLQHHERCFSVHGFNSSKTMEFYCLQIPPKTSKVLQSSTGSFLSITIDSEFSKNITRRFKVHNFMEILLYLYGVKHDKVRNLDVRKRRRINLYYYIPSFLVNNKKS